MTPPPTGRAPQPTRAGTHPVVLTVLDYAWRRTLLEIRRPALWVAVALATLLGYAGAHLEILQFDDSPQRTWGLLLSTAETLALLLALGARVRGADLVGEEGWSDALRASTLGAPGLCAAETLGAAVAAWVGAAMCSLLLVLSTHVAPAYADLVRWGGALLVELALLSAWLALAAMWLGRLAGLGIAIVVVLLGRLGVGGLATALWPTPVPVPPESASVAAVAGSVAALLGITAMTTIGRSAARSAD